MKKVLPFLISITILTALAGYSAKAQTEPFILITWKALNYAPANFEGKVLPMQNSPIVASVALLQNGKFIDISKMQIKWSVNSQQLQSGTGLQTIIFQEPDLGGGSNSTDITVEIPNYPGGSILNTISISPTQPKAVIDAPYPNLQFASSQLNITAVPYFFNVNNISGLDISWMVNSVSPTDLTDPSSLQIKFGQQLQNGTVLPINLNITQISDSLFGKASSDINLIYNNEK